MRESLLVSPDKEGPYGEYLKAGLTHTEEFIVPADVRSLCIVCIGAGGAQTSAYRGGGGGGLAYRNHIPVTPGESLTLLFNHSTGKGLGTTVSRRGVMICSAGHGDRERGGLGGKLFFSENDGGGNGGNGRANSYGSGAGGAGGYTGNGGEGAYSNGTFSFAASEGNGGGGGGGGRYNNNSSGAGGGTYPFGRGVNGQAGTNTQTGIRSGGQGSFADGNNRTTTYGGGSNSTSKTQGCIRIIWGADREFPSKNVGAS